MSPVALKAGAVLSTALGRSVSIRGWRGEGSYARVYEAALAGGPCAVKLAKAEVPEGPDRIAEEEGVLARVAHPHVVRLLDRGDHAGVPFLVLEWLEGETLLDTVKARRRLPLRQSLELLENVCDGLTGVHGGDLIHGDIRPQNVLIVRGRGAVLTDPGAGDLSGQTPPSAAGDVRAVGSLLHLMLTGEEAQGAPRLTAAAGYNRGAVQLWERTQAARPPAARELLEAVRALRRSL